MVDVSLATLLFAAGCLLAVGFVLWPKRVRHHEADSSLPGDEIDARLNGGLKWDPFRPEDNLANRMRAIRSQAAEARERQDFYQLLGVGPGATDAEIERAFRARVIAVHPDRFVGDPRAQEAAAAALRQLNQAVSVLRDPLARARYDAGRWPE